MFSNTIIAHYLSELIANEKTVRERFLHHNETFIIVSRKVKVYILVVASQSRRHH